MKITVNLLAYAVFVIISIASFLAIKDINNLWDAKSNDQRRNNYQVTTSIEEWKSLDDFRVNWSTYFDKESSASISRHELYKKLELERIGLMPSVTKIVTSNTEDLNHDDMPVDISRTCVRNSPSGMLVFSGNIKEMLVSLQKLQARQNVIFNDVTFMNKIGKPEILIRDLCVLFRLDGEV
jgi:hypothetical protein